MNLVQLNILQLLFQFQLRNEELFFIYYYSVRWPYQSWTIEPGTYLVICYTKTNFVAPTIPEIRQFLKSKSFITVANIIDFERKDKLIPFLDILFLAFSCLQFT